VDKIARLETDDDLGDVGGVAAQFLGEFTHAAAGLGSSEHAGVGGTEPMLARRSLPRLVVGVDELEHGLFDVRRGARGD